MHHAVVTPEVLAQRILPLLPQDGTPVLNRVMRVMLSRQLEIQIEPDLYFAARDLLLQSGKIGRLRGQSGQIFLAALNGAQPAAAEPAPKEPSASSHANDLVQHGRQGDHRALGRHPEAAQTLEMFDRPHARLP